MSWERPTSFPQTVRLVSRRAGRTVASSIYPEHGSMAFRFWTVHTGPMESGLKIENGCSRRGYGGGGFEVYRGKGRRARRLHPSASGGILFSLFMRWLRGKA